MPTGTKPDPPDYSLRVEYEGTYLGATWAVVHWFLTGGAGAIAPSDLDATATDLYNAFKALCTATGFSNSLHFTTTRTTIFLPASQSMKRVHVADATGPSSSGPLPAQVCMLFNWSTLDGRRGGKSRSYLCGLDSSIVTESYSILSSQLANLNTDAATYIAAVNAISHGTVGTLQFVEMSFVSGGAYRVSPVTYAIYAGAVNPVVATQRRRVDRQRP